MNVSFSIDSSQVNNLSLTLARVIGQYDWIAARAMTNAAKAAKAQLAEEVLPRIAGGATAWTKRGLMASFASPNNLTSNVGWNYGDGSFKETGFTGKGMGVPSGRYMGIQAAGGDRSAKSFELALRRAGLIRSDQFVTPASSGVKLNSFGNLTGGQYQQILSRLNVQNVGSIQSARGAGSRGRTATKRAALDYFMMYGDAGDGARFIAKRVGSGPKGGTGKGSHQPGRPQTSGYRRGFVPALFVVDHPNYESRFDIRGIALREYSRVFPVEFQKALDYEMKRRS